MQFLKKLLGGVIEILCFRRHAPITSAPDWKHRYGRDIRYPGVLQTLLGDGYYVAEDGLVGRKTAIRIISRDGPRNMVYNAF